MESSRQKCYIVVDSVELSDFPFASSLLRNESSSSFLFPSTPSPTSASSSSLSMTLSPSTRCLSGWIANDSKTEDPQSSHQRNPSRTTSKEADAIMIMTRQPDKPRTTSVAMRNNIQSAYCPHRSWRNSYSVAALGVLLVFALMSHVAEGKGSAIFGKGGSHTVCHSCPTAEFNPMDHIGILITLFVIIFIYLLIMWCKCYPVLKRCCKKGNDISKNTASASVPDVNSNSTTRNSSSRRKSSSIQIRRLDQSAFPANNNNNNNNTRGSSARTSTTALDIELGGGTVMPPEERRHSGHNSARGSRSGSGTGQGTPPRISIVSSGDIGQPLNGHFIPMSDGSVMPMLMPQSQQSNLSQLPPSPSVTRTKSLVVPKGRTTRKEQRSGSVGVTHLMASSPNNNGNNNAPYSPHHQYQLPPPSPHYHQHQHQPHYHSHHRHSVAPIHMTSTTTTPS